MNTLTQHPLSAAFPAMQSDEYQDLLDSIIETGVLSPITIYDGMVIDGWHRYRAAIECGMRCPTIDLRDVDPVEFVKGMNLHRRHLTGSQRAAAIVACSNWHPSHRETRQVVATDFLKTDAQMASAAGVSISTVGHVKAAQKAGLIDVVRDGGMTAAEAAKVARGTDLKLAKHVPPPPEIEDDAIHILSEENDRLNDRLAVVAMDATEDERAAAAVTLSELRALVKTLTAELDAVKASRDNYMMINKELMAQCAAQRRQLDKLNKK